jgi:hypothetical protein
MLSRREVWAAAAGILFGGPAFASTAEFDPKAFGAVGDGIHDDTAAVMAAHRAALNAGGAVIFQAGQYRINGWVDKLAAPVTWMSSDDATIIVCNHSIDFRAPSRQVKLFGAAKRNDMSLLLGRDHNINGPALIYFESKIAVDRVRSEPIICQTIQATGAQDDSVLTDAPMNFDFDPLIGDVACTIFDNPRYVRFVGLRFVTDISNRDQRAVTLSGIAPVEALFNCSFETNGTGSRDKLPDGVMIQQSCGVTVRTLRFQNCRYGLMISRGARDILGYDIEGGGCRHVVYPAYWAYRCVFRKVVGNGNVATMDSHSAFDIRYEDVTALGDAEMSNIRSSGATLLRATFKLAPGSGNRLLWISAPAWIPTYQDLYAERDVCLSSVSVSYSGSPPSDGVAVRIGGAGHILVENFHCDVKGLKLQVYNTPEEQVQVLDSNLALVFG